MCPSPLVLFPAIFSTFGLTAYYSELLEDQIPPELAVTILMLPISMIVLIQAGDWSARIVKQTHYVAVALYSLLALGMEISILRGFRPDDLLLYRVMTHLGWTLGWAVILQQARSLRCDERKI